MRFDRGGRTQLSCCGFPGGRSRISRRGGLLRLEFEVFVLDTLPAVSSSGKIACRDLVVGPAVDVSRDASKSRADFVSQTTSGLAVCAFRR